MEKTEFASAERMDKKSLLEIYEMIKSTVVIETLMSKLDQQVFILNSTRQTVYANKAAIEINGINSIDDIIGLRPGEIFDCVNACIVNGCGTSKFCRECGAVNAILNTQQTLTNSVEECVILSKNGNTYELAVTTKPFYYREKWYTLFSISDISLVKRMEILEKIFFHDVINIAGGINSMLRLMDDSSITDKKKLQDLLVSSSEQLLNEINAHKTLKAAESNDLLVQFISADSLKVLKKAVEISEQLKCAFGKVIYVDADSEDVEFETDETLLNRVLINMLSNALEASGTGDRITAAVRINGGHVVFSVNNRQAIPVENRHKIFRKSFTTKKHGSGLGTHSIKLLTEKYLKGKASFASDEETGTTFSVRFRK